MATITITKLHSLLSQKIGEEAAETLTTYITEKTNEEVEAATKEIATKDFVAKEISESKTEIIKWVFGLFVTLAIMIVGLYGSLFYIFSQIKK
jgi:nitrate reductase NapE component